MSVHDTTTVEPPTDRRVEDRRQEPRRAVDARRHYAEQAVLAAAFDVADRVRNLGHLDAAVANYRRALDAGTTP